MNFNQIRTLSTAEQVLLAYTLSLRQYKDIRQGRSKSMAQITNFNLLIDEDERDKPRWKSGKVIHVMQARVNKIAKEPYTGPYPLFETYKIHTNQTPELKIRWNPYNCDLADWNRWIDNAIRGWFGPLWLESGDLNYQGEQLDFDQMLDDFCMVFMQRKGTEEEIGVIIQRKAAMEELRDNA